MNSKDNTVFLSRDYRSESCFLKFDVLKTGIKFARGNYQPIVPQQKHYIRFKKKSRAHNLIVL